MAEPGSSVLGVATSSSQRSLSAKRSEKGESSSSNTRCLRSSDPEPSKKRKHPGSGQVRGVKQGVVCISEDSSEEEKAEAEKKKKVSTKKSKRSSSASSVSIAPKKALKKIRQVTEGKKKGSRRVAGGASHSKSTCDKSGSSEALKKKNVIDTKAKKSKGQREVTTRRLSQSSSSCSSGSSSDSDTPLNLRSYPLRSKSQLDKKPVSTRVCASSTCTSKAFAKKKGKKKTKSKASSLTLGGNVSTNERETTGNSTQQAEVLKSSEASTSQQNESQSTVQPSLFKKRSARRKTGSCASTSRKSLRRGKAPLPDYLGESTVASTNMSSAGENEQPVLDPATVTTATSASTSEAVSVSTATSSTATATAPSGEKRSTWASLIGATSGVVGSLNLDSDNDENEVGRLQALLEARGLPPHLLTALAPRMQHLLQRGPSANTKAQQLLQGLLAVGDEGRQLQALIEMCQMLVMGNEDTLAGFPVKQAVPALTTLLSMEHNFEMMNQACRALTYMMEVLPRSSAIVLEAVPVFLQKLQVIQCMDVAEQSLTALDALSKRHSKAILQARGVSACLTYLDFFSIVAQRAALSVTANCCQNLTPDEYPLVQPSLHLLSSKLTQPDKKSVESVCLVFTRLVDSFQKHPTILRDVANTNELLSNFQQLLVVSPPILTTNTFISVLRMLTTMCMECPDLATLLLKQNIACTLCYLLTGSPDGVSGKDEVELISRSPQELYEITCLIGELLPKLPQDGIFCVEALLERQTPLEGVQHHDATVLWQWKDDRAIWHSYSSIDCRIIEAAHQSGEEDVSMTTSNRVYTIDFHLMQQINDDTGTTRPVKRVVIPPDGLIPCVGGELTAVGDGSVVDFDREEMVTSEAAKKEDNNIVEGNLASSFIKSLFSVLYEVYSSSAGPSIRQKCLRALLKMVYYSSPNLLKEVLKNQLVSSHIAGMMASQDLRIIVGSLQMAEILMHKLPEVFGIHFTREGVIYQVQQLTVIQSSPTKLTKEGSPRPNAPPAVETAAVSASPTPRYLVHPTFSVYPTSDCTTSLLTGSTEGDAGSSSSGSECPVDNNNPEFGDSTTPEYDSVVLDASSGAASGTQNVSPPDNGAMFSAMVITPPEEGVSTSSTQQQQQHRGVNAMSSSFYNLVADLGTSRAGTSSGIRFSEVLKRKRPKRPIAASSNPAPPKRMEDAIQSAHSSMHDMFQLSASSRPNYSDIISNAGASSRCRGIREGGGAGASGGGNPSSSSSGSATSSSTATALPRSRNYVMKTTSSIWASFNPKTWGRSAVDRPFPKEMVGSSKGSGCGNSGISGASGGPGGNISAGNREKIKAWIRDRAKEFLASYNVAIDSANSAVSGEGTGRLSVLAQLTEAVSKLSPQLTHDLVALSELKDIVITSDISPFEVNHSGLVQSLLHYLTDCTNGTVERNRRLRNFINVFANCPLNSNIVPKEKPKPEAMSALVNKLNCCVSQLEQFPVKVHDLPTGTGGGSTTALKFFNTHQLKCLLQRHPDCSNLKQWKGGTVKIDPLALVQAIERYLVVRGYARIRDKESTSVESDDDNSDEDIDDTLAAVVISQSGAKHRLQFLIGNHVLPYNMTVYQAIRQFSPSVTGDFSENDTDTENMLGSANVWVQTHTVYYRPVPDDCGASGSGSTSGGTCTSKAATASSSGTSCGKSAKTGKPKKKRDELWTDGIAPPPKSPLEHFLSGKLPVASCVKDPSLPVVSLLRVLHAICRYWGSLYPSIDYKPILIQQEFVNTKISAKANRQLQDPLVIMTGNLPSWLQQVASACPFLLPFETRQLLFYVTVFDRDRALQRLLDSSPELHGSADTHDRVAPRLDRRKRTISRDDILKQAEVIISDVASSKALLEVQYEDEVGTGLGPTLEFYALVSKEFQRSDLKMWADSGDNKGKHVFSPVGLFPSPLGRTTKVSQLMKIQSKFRFLGKLMAKAVMDSRLLDLSLSPTFYRWLLTQEYSLTICDLQYVVPDIYKTIARMHKLAVEKHYLEHNSGLSISEIQQRTSGLKLDGCSIEDLSLDFTLPGYSHIELKKGGRDHSLTLQNVDKYCKLVSHWYLLEGVHRQMESFREGFESVFPLSRLNMFYPEEMDSVFCGAETGWDVKMLMEAFRADHGYTADCRTIQNLFQVLSSYKPQEQRDFLQFVTGSPRLPVGGFKSLSPLLTVVRSTLEANANPDDYLPSVMTCVNYLKLPEYSSIEVMREKLRIASSEGQNSFHLS